MQPTTPYHDQLHDDILAIVGGSAPTRSWLKPLGLVAAGAVTIAGGLGAYSLWPVTRASAPVATVDTSYLNVDLLAANRGSQDPGAETAPIEGEEATAPVQQASAKPAPGAHAQKARSGSDRASRLQRYRRWLRYRSRASGKAGTAMADASPVPSPVPPLPASPLDGGRAERNQAHSAMIEQYRKQANAAASARAQYEADQSAYRDELARAQRARVQYDATHEKIR